MSPPRYLLDRWGTCIGKIDDAGYYFDAQGRHVGQVLKGCAVFDCDGLYLGRIDALGQFWDGRGHFLGYIAPSSVTDSRH